LRHHPLLPPVAVKHSYLRATVNQRNTTFARPGLRGLSSIQQLWVRGTRRPPARFDLLQLSQVTHGLGISVPAARPLR